MASRLLNHAALRCGWRLRFRGRREDGQFTETDGPAGLIEALDDHGFDTGEFVLDLIRQGEPQLTKLGGQVADKLMADADDDDCGLVELVAKAVAEDQTFRMSTGGSGWCSARRAMHARSPFSACVRVSIARCSS